MTTFYKRLVGTVGAFNNDDYYSFYVAGTKTVTLDLFSYVNSPTLRLYDSTGGLLSTDSVSLSGTADSTADLVAVLSTGRYYARVTSSNYSPYSLSISTGTPVIGNGSSDAGGNTTVTATSLGILNAAPLTFADYVGGSDNFDYYSFNVGTMSTVNLMITGLSETVTAYILNASGQRLATVSGGSASGIVYTYIVPPLSVGTYYLELNDTNTRAGSGYNLSLSATAIPDLAGSTIATARPLGTLSAAVQSFSDEVNPNDTDDYYSFSISSVSHLSLLLNGVTDTATVSLFDSAGRQIGFSYNASPYSDGSYLVDLSTLQVGTYFMDVSTSFTQTNYTLSLAAQPIPDLAGLNTATAYPLSPTSAPLTVTDFVGDQDTLDEYRITLAAAATLNLRLVAGQANVPTNATLNLLDAAGSTLIGVVSAATSDGLITINLAPGTYYANVSERFGSNTSYTLTYYLGAPVVGSASSDGAGNTLATARNIGPPSAAGVTYADWVGTVDGDDYYQFTLPTTETVSFDEVGANNRVTLNLLDVSGRSIASDSSFQTQDVSVVRQLGPGTYFLDASGSSNTGYNLTITGTPIIDIAGNSIAAANNIGTLGPATQTFSDFVGAVDPADYYQFTLSSAALVKSSLVGLSTSTNLYLLDISGNQITSTRGSDASNASLTSALAAGTYFYEVTYSGPTNYTLSITQTPIQDVAGPTLGTAYNAGVVTANLRGDFTGDAKTDVLLQNDNGAMFILGQSNLAVTGGYNVGNAGATWHLLGTADFNGDGQTDLLLQNSNGQILDYLMNGTTIASGHYLGENPGPSWHVRGTGDFNYDGNADLVLQNDNGAIVLWYTNGTGVTGTAYVTNPGSGWTVEGVGDFNGDGMSDILIEDKVGEIVDYSMNRAVIGYTGFIGTTGPGWAIVGTGDYSGDGVADIVLHNGNGADVIWQTNGSALTGAVYVGNPGPSYTGAVAGADLNGDGASDLVLQGTDSSLVGFTFNNNAIITAGASLGIPGTGWHAVGNTPMQFIDGTGANLNLTATVGADQFDLSSYGQGPHYIAAFNPTQDSVVLRNATFPNFTAVQAAELPYQGGTYLALNTGAALIIQGITPDQLGTSNFILR